MKKQIFCKKICKLKIAPLPPPAHSLSSCVPDHIRIFRAISRPIDSHFDSRYLYSDDFTISHNSAAQIMEGEVQSVGPAFSASRVITFSDLPSDEKEQMMKFLVENNVAVRGNPRWRPSLAIPWTNPRELHLFTWVSPPPFSPSLSLSVFQRRGRLLRCECSAVRSPRDRPGSEGAPHDARTHRVKILEAQSVPTRDTAS